MEWVVYKGANSDSRIEIVFDCTINASGKRDDEWYDVKERFHFSAYLIVVHVECYFKKAKDTHPSIVARCNSATKCN